MALQTKTANNDKPLSRSCDYLPYSSISELPAKVLGDKIIELEDYQYFQKQGFSVDGGTASARLWDDKTYVPVTLVTQCIDCLHCVVACPHSSITYEVKPTETHFLVEHAKNLLNKLPGFNLSPETNDFKVSKSDTDYRHCKGCFVCASACPVDAIHFVPQDRVNEKVFHGEKIEPEKVRDIFKNPDIAHLKWIDGVVNESIHLIRNHRATTGASSVQITDGTTMLVDFIFQSRFDHVCIYPITPNTKVITQVEARLKKDPKNPMKYRATLSEEAGYAFLTGASVQGKRVLMCQGSQSLAQLYEFLNISPGLRLPIFMLELTRALNPGTSLKPDHTTTMRTTDTGEIVVFGRTLQDNYDKALLLLKLMETDDVWLPGRLVIKGFFETHTLQTANQAHFSKLTQEQVDAYLEKPQNPYVFDKDLNRAIGVLDIDARYSEERFAMDQNINMAGQKFDAVAARLAAFTHRDAIKKVDRFPKDEGFELCIVGLNDPDFLTIEYVAETLRSQGISCGAVSINLYRPFPGKELAAALHGAKAVAILEYDNWSGRHAGGVLAQEVRSALYTMESRPEIIAAQVGLGGRSVTVSYIVTLYRMLADLAKDPHTSTTRQWLDQHAANGAFALGTRGAPFPETSQNFDIPINQPHVEHMTVVGRGGQGLMVLNTLYTAILAQNGKHVVSMAAYGALQRGGGICLNIKSSDEQIRDRSEIVITDTLVSFNGDKSLETMLTQLKPGGTLIFDAELQNRQSFENLRKDCRVIGIPASAIARKIFGKSNQTNMIMLGAMLAHDTPFNEEELLNIINSLLQDKALKLGSLLGQEDNIKAILSGYKIYKLSVNSKVHLLPLTENAADSLEAKAFISDELDKFVRKIVPKNIYDKLDNPKKLKALKERYALKKKLYQLMFAFHPMVNQIQGLYIKLKGDSPLSPGDMACAGCGQINIFRIVFNYLHYLQDNKGRLYVSEQDGCGTVFTSMNRTTTWNLPFIRIAFETAHGVAAGLANHKNSDDLIVSISGDGGFLQGLRSVEDTLHQQDPIFHIVVVNQVLGNTGGQATGTTMTGETTSEGHKAVNQPVNLLKYAEKYQVNAALATTVHLWDLYDKVRWGHDVVRKQRKPFVLLLHFSCLMQGMNLAQSLSAQKMALDSHFFVLHSLRFKPVYNRRGKLLFHKKRLSIDWFPLTFGQWQWKKRLLEYLKTQKMGRSIVKDPETLDKIYWDLRGEWRRLKNEMGWTRYYLRFFTNLFSISRLTMNRLINKRMPEEAK